MSLDEVGAVNAIGNSDHPSELRSDALQDLLHRVGGKWTIHVLAALYARSHRFNELRGVIPGVSQRSLSLVMHALQRDGLVNRTIFPVVPPRVDYDITDLGVSFVEALTPLGNWCEESAPQVSRARTRYDELIARAPEVLL